MPIAGKEAWSRNARKKQRRQNKHILGAAVCNSTLAAEGANTTGVGVGTALASAVEDTVVYTGVLAENSVDAANGGERGDRAVLGRAREGGRSVVPTGTTATNTSDDELPRKRKEATGVIIYEAEVHTEGPATDGVGDSWALVEEPDVGEDAEDTGPIAVRSGGGPSSGAPNKLSKTQRKYTERNARKAAVRTLTVRSTT